MSAGIFRGVAAARAEPWIVWALGAIAFAAVPVALGGIGISWDGLNHHFYLGWVAQQPRFDQDIAAASYQAFQFPYLYWPAYRMAVDGASGVTAGIVLALLQSLAVPPTWLVARACCPGDEWLDRALRWFGVVLAFLGGVSLSLLDSTSNDMLASIPLLWAVALAFVAADVNPGQPRRVATWTLLSGACAGVAVACKLSNGPLVLVLPLAWVMAPGSGAQRLQRVVLAGLAAVGGFLLAYGYWGWQLWLHTGNPIYPFYDGAFGWLRAITGWTS
jgi:hypothetical protein